MIKIKHLMDPVEKDDGPRLWVEPMGLTKDLREWCQVEHLLTHLGPPMKLWRWFEAHPDGFSSFRGQYHEHLSRSKYRNALRELAGAGLRSTFTLLHTGDDAEHNSAVALYEYLIELQSYCSNEE
ncbi:MAG: DUF488 family protein [Tepidisphaerales bacterium]